MLSGLRSSIYRVSRPAIASASAMQPSKAWAQSAVRRGHGFVYNPPATIHVQKLNLVFVDEEVSHRLKRISDGDVDLI
jgi:hypothetical protein